MFVLLRAAVYSVVFIGFLLVFLPARILAGSGITVPPLGPQQVLGAAITAAGAALALSCILTFVRLGRGTPAPFDPPRKLVVRGPYKYVRNPMYLGAAAALLGAAIYYGSWALAGYALAFLLSMAAFARLYEEPTLRRTFGAEYEEYCSRVGRWLPLWPPRP